MAGFTPGPWQTNGSHVYGPDPKRELVCQALTDHGRLVADRDLIAAAPELYGALETTIDRVELASKMHHNSQDWHSEDALGNGGGTLWDWVFAPARAALAKARGEQVGDMRFDPSCIAANRGNTSYSAEDVLVLARKGAELGILFHIDGLPFGEHREPVSA